MKIIYESPVRVRQPIVQLKPIGEGLILVVKETQQVLARVLTRDQALEMAQAVQQFYKETNRNEKTR